MFSFNLLTQNVAEVKETTLFMPKNFFQTSIICESFSNHILKKEFIKNDLNPSQSTNVAQNVDGNITIIS